MFEEYFLGTSLQNVFCRRAPGHQRLQVQQWECGANAIKPTTLRTMGLPPSARVMRSQASTTAVKPYTKLEGVDAQMGAFRTAKAKENPGDFCKALSLRCSPDWLTVVDAKDLVSGPSPCSKRGILSGFKR